MQKRILPFFLAAALLLSGVLSVFSIHKLQDYARVINYAGVVRSTTQQVVKQELCHLPNDRLILRIDELLAELASGEGEHGLIRLNNEDFQAFVRQMQIEWLLLKKEIQNVRMGDNGALLYTQSENFFRLANRAVSAAEEYTTRNVRKTERISMLAIGVFLAAAGGLMWHGTVQSKRQQQLKDEEERNRARSEYLDRMARELRAPMNDISELLYVSDLETYDLLFINDAGKRTFHVDDVAGKKCYRALQGLDRPCPFCNSAHLRPGEICTWEHTNGLNGVHYLLKDRLLEWDGRPARMEIAFDMTELEQRKQELQHALDSENMIMDCVRTLYQDSSFERAVSEMLRQLGSFLSAGRAYIFTVHGGLLEMKYEWCAEDVKPQINVLSHLPCSLIKRWLPYFDRQECVIIENTEEVKKLSPEEYEVLRLQDIHTLVAAPLERDGKLSGCLGVDNPPPDRLRNIAPLLQTLGYFVMLAWRRSESELELSRLSYFDTLTKFYNRNRYIQDTEVLAAAHRPVGIVFLDVNGLKDVNDRQGHAKGDRILTRCAELMREVFPEKTDFYRIGGDEFVAICLGAEQEKFEEQVRELRLRFHTDEQCSAAVGAQWSSDSGDVRQIIADTDAKMYEDKKVFYRRNPSSNRYRHGSDELLHLANPDVLREKIRKEQFVVYFQPKVSSSDQAAVGAEALVRYRPHPDTLVLPGNFLPLLEEHQLIRQLDFFVFDFVCSKVKEWMQNGRQTIPVSVNFSRCSLSQPDFLEELVSTCSRYGIERQYLEIEITENIREEDSINLKELVPSLRQAGFAVSIDDFGTEYANLALLSSVQFDELKLDKSVVDNVAHSPQAQAVVESIVEACRKMKIRLVAEGIETEEQLAILRSCGVKLVQGFLVGKPCPIEEYEKKYL